MFVYWLQVQDCRCCCSSRIAFSFVIQRSGRGGNSSPELGSQWRASPPCPCTWRQATSSERPLQCCCKAHDRLFSAALWRPGPCVHTLDSRKVQMSRSSRPKVSKCVHTPDAVVCHPCMRCAVLPDGAMLLACVGTAAPGARVHGHEGRAQSNFPRVERKVPSIPRPTRTFARGLNALPFPVLCFRQPPALTT